jgi:cobalt-zinc-cadmium resistance protein CzcA
MWWKASLLLQKGADADPALKGIEAKVIEINGTEAQPAVPGGFFHRAGLQFPLSMVCSHKGVKVVPFLDRSDLIHLTTHTVLHNLTEGIVLVVIILMLFLGNVRGAIIVALTIPFALLFASICLDLEHIPANLLSLGALDFGMVVDGAVVMIENIVRHLNRHDEHERRDSGQDSCAAHEVQRPVFYAIGIIITAYLPDLHTAGCRRPSLQADGLDGCLCLARRAHLFHDYRAGAGQFSLSQRAKEWHNPVMNFLTDTLPQGVV